MQGEYSAIYRDVFNFHKERTKQLRNDADFWEDTAGGAVQIAESHGNALFCMNLLCVVVEELERRALEQQGEGQCRGA